MKKLMFLVVIGALGGVLAVTQITRFTKFLSYFPSVPIPVTFDNFSTKNGEVIPSELALEFICLGDSSLLTYENIGRNQETQKIVYKELKLYKYKGYAKFQVDNYFFLIYDGYVKDGEHEFTKVINIGLFSDKGVLLDEMPFYIFDDTGKLKELTGEINIDYEIIIKSRDYDKNEKGVFKLSYKEINDTYEINKGEGKFIKTNQSITSHEK